MAKQQWNRKYGKETPTKGEINNEPSQTIQGETYTIRELYEKGTKGLDINVNRSPIWGEDEPTHDSLDLMSVANLDLAEIQEHLAEIKAHVKVTEAQLKQKQDDIKNKEEEAKQEQQMQLKSESETKAENVK